MHWILELDRALFLLINGCHTPWADVLMITASNKYFWIWLYLFACIYLIYKYKLKGLYIIVSVFLAFVITDWVSVHVFKNLVERYRPCQMSGFAAQVNLPDKHACQSLYGFVSSHAANTACIASFLLLPGFLNFKKRKIESLLVVLFVVYVFLNCYSRVYLGVHFPGDVFCGLLLGILIGWVTGRLTKRLIPNGFEY